MGGRSRIHPEIRCDHGVQEISIVAELETDADDASLAKLGELTERYCVVGQSLAAVPSITVRKRTAP